MLALLQQGLPAVPLLLLGLAFSEGRELVRRAARLQLEPLLPGVGGRPAGPQQPAHAPPAAGREAPPSMPAHVSSNDTPIHPSARPQAAHELSVPAVTMFSGSALAFAVGVAGALLLLDSLPRHARAALQAAGPFGAVVTEAAVHGLGSPLGFVAAAAAAVVGLLLRLADAAAA